MRNIARLDALLRAAGLPVAVVSGVQGVVRVDYLSGATAQQRTQGAALVSSYDWSATADATFGAKQQKALAAEQVDNGELQAAQASERLYRAIVLLLLDELNAHSTTEAGIVAAVAAATSLADLKTRMAVVATVPQRTIAQMVGAIKSKIAGTAE